MMDFITYGNSCANGGATNCVFLNTGCGWAEASVYNTSICK